MFLNKRPLVWALSYVLEGTFWCFVYRRFIEGETLARLIPTSGMSAALARRWLLLLLLLHDKLSNNILTRPFRTWCSLK